MLVAGALSGSSAAASDADSAAAIYQQQCATCHGADGQGAEGAYGQPLAGDQSVAALAQLIERTMPQGEPELCVGEEAREVAAFVHREFYSLEARQRKGLVASPRVELVRLTVPQYRNAVADLIGHFTDASRSQPDRANDGADEESEPQPGLHAEYFQSKGMNKADSLKQERVDRYIDFDYGEGSPAEAITPDQFVIVWQGALIADKTGYYEFRIRSENGVRLYINRDGTGRRHKLRDDSSVAGEPALIDGWVSSGKMRELTARIFLLGGRRYPLRLEFFKYLQKTASVQLQWKPPHGAWTVLDQNHLSTGQPARVFVLETPFPADDRSTGYERGSSVSAAWHTATTNAAVATAAEVIDRLPQLTGLQEVGPEDNDERQKRLKDFVARFASIAFRRPLSEAEKQLFREALFADASDPKAAVRRAVLLTLTSPHFLYTDLTPAGQSPTQYTAAAQLAFTLWDSLPDQALLDAARNGQLATDDQIKAQAERMVDHPRTKAKMRGFFQHWLELESRDLAKDTSLFPEFDDATRTELRYSLERFLDQVLWSEASDYRQLLLADYLILNDRLRDIYQKQHEDVADAPEDEAAQDDAPDSYPGSDFQVVTFDSGQRAGLLTHPYLLSAFAYHNNTSPIHRGVFLARSIVGRSLRPPPVAVSFKNEEFDPNLTMREKITLLTSDAACMSCHSVINPLGFTLENYDAVGRWRTSDNNKVINTTSEYTTVEGEILEFDSAREVAQYAVASESAQQAFITDLFHHLVKQSPLAYGAETLGQLHARFVANDFNMQKLLAEIAVVSATPPSTDSPAANPQASIAPSSTTSPNEREES